MPKGEYTRKSTLVNKHKYRPILQLDKQLKLINRHESLTAAAKHINLEKYATVMTSVSRCLIGDRPYAYNFVWQYENGKLSDIAIKTRAARLKRFNKLIKYHQEQLDLNLKKLALYEKVFSKK